MKANFSVMSERSIFASYDVMIPVQKFLAGNSHIVRWAVKMRSLHCSVTSKLPLSELLKKNTSAV